MEPPLSPLLTTEAMSQTVEMSLPWQPLQIWHLVEEEIHYRLQIYLPYSKEERRAACLGFLAPSDHLTKFLLPTTLLAAFAATERCNRAPFSVTSLPHCTPISLTRLTSSSSSCLRPWQPFYESAAARSVSAGSKSC